MKKYVVPIASRDIDLSRIKFSEPLSCEIDNNKINITYKKHLDSNTYKTVKNKTGVNFKGEIVKNKDTIDLVGDFHCSTQFKILYITAAILIALCACYIALSDFVKVWVVMAEIFDKEGNFLMKVNHGRGVTSVYLNFRDGLTSFLLHGKGKEYEEPNYYHEFVVDISNKKILNKNTYKEAQIEIENPNRSRYYMKEDTLYTIRDDKVYIEGDGVDKVLDLNSPKSPIFFGYFFILAAMGVSLLFFTRLRYR